MIGNITQDTKFRNLNYSYDANGRMFKTSNTANTSESNAVYDASGNRVAQQIDGGWTYFIYDAFSKLVAEYGGQPVYDEGGIKYVYQDWQGSTRAVMGAGGAILARSDYTAFGEEIGANVGQRTAAQGFTSNNSLNQKYALTERDKATGLDHTWFRKNENRAGRWTSPDPYNGSMSIGDPQSFNRYSYVSNQPINFVDPSGLFRSGPNTRYGPAVEGFGAFNGGLAGAMYLEEQALKNMSFPIEYTVYEDGSVTTTFTINIGGTMSIPILDNGGYSIQPPPQNQEPETSGGFPEPTSTDNKSAQQKAFNDCARKAYNSFRSTYIKDGGKTVLGTGLIIVGVWAIFRGYKMGAAAASHTGEPIEAIDHALTAPKAAGMASLGPIGLGGVLINNAINSTDAAGKRLNTELKNCEKSYPNATHSLSFLNF